MSLITKNLYNKFPNIKIKSYLKLMRVHHYLKNILIVLPLIFSAQLLYIGQLSKVIIGFIVYCLASSIVYIINDIQDVESDRQHEVKCMRPIASGEISITSAWSLVILLAILIVGLNYFLTGIDSGTWIVIVLYIVLNMGYSYGLKNVPLIDIAILVSGFLLRVIYGAQLINIEVSKWLYLTVIGMSFYLGLGKRRNEIVKQGEKGRKVLKYYNHAFLDKNMYMCLAITVVFYSLWCVDPQTILRHSSDNIIWTVPLVILICMKYSLNIEGNSHGDPVDVLLSDKILILLVFVYGAITFGIIYMNSIFEMIVGLFS